MQSLWKFHVLYEDVVSFLNRDKEIFLLMIYKDDQKDHNGQ